MTAEEDQARGTLLENGYTDIPEVRGIRVGSRVRHRGEQWREAERNGTGTVIFLMENVNSWWSRQYHERDIELIVRPDTDTHGPVRNWADYHTALAEDAQVSA